MFQAAVVYTPSQGRPPPPASLCSLLTSRAVDDLAREERRELGGEIGVVVARERMHERLALAEVAVVALHRAHVSHAGTPPDQSGRGRGGSSQIWCRRTGPHVGFGGGRGRPRHTHIRTTRVSAGVRMNARVSDAIFLYMPRNAGYGPRRNHRKMQVRSLRSLAPLVVV